MRELNEFGQEIGCSVPNWQPQPFPRKTALVGTATVVEPFTVDKHASDLFATLCRKDNDASWTYLPYGPFSSLQDFSSWANKLLAQPDLFLYAICDLKTRRALGTCAFMRINPEHGTIEIGHVNFAAQLKRTFLATEALYLMMSHCFDTLQYRRCEWKCNSLNAASRRAALRLGFTFEGIFRNCNVFKARNRDTAWFSIIDSEWPTLKPRYERWLHPSNFTTDGAQRTSLLCI